MRPIRELPRLLHTRSQYGYTSRPSEALALEPEAVPAEYQADLTRRATQTAKQRTDSAVREAHDSIVVELDKLSETPLDRRTVSHVRAMRRQLAQLAQSAGLTRVF